MRNDLIHNILMALTTAIMAIAGYLAVIVMVRLGTI